MKTIVMLTALLMASSAYAENNSTSGSYAGSQSGVQINNKAGRAQAPTAIAPGLTASGLSCSGSGSVGGSVGGFGLAFGMSREDKYCNAREDAKYIQGVTGDKGAAKERLCDTPEIAAAYARAGRPCASRNTYARR